MRRLRPILLVCAAFALLVPLLVAQPATSQTGAPPAPAPAGLTGFAQPARAVLSWKPSAGAGSYELYRGTSAGSITTRVTPAGFSGTTFADTSVSNNTTYYYAVRAVSAGGTSSTDQVARVTPRAATCSTGNAVAVENCMPGTTAWKSLNASTMFNGGIEGYLSASSVNAGGSVDLRVSTDWNTPYRVEIYRTGYYGGDRGRLVSVIQGRVGGMGFCRRDHSTTGLTDCSDWGVTTTITTGSGWVSGVYMLKLVREDNGEYSDALLVVRNDGSTSQVLYGVPTSTYQAYNAWGGKSTYEWSSDGPHTVTGFNRAVYASLDRPYSQPPSNASAHDWYTRTDVAAVAWLERQGYDVTYTSSESIHANGAQLQSHEVFVSGAHDEYWSTQMFDAAVAARDAGTSLFFLGANAAYWRIRYAASPQSGTADRVMVVYKTIQGGPADPVTSTSTWRDPAGPSRPENQLLGQMYIGDNASASFPLRVSAQEGRHRMWRYTPLSSLATGTSAAVGTAIVGWEWDARVANGLEPAGVQTIASSAVEGNLVQGNGAAYTYGPAVANATYYRAASGAVVFATGTNNWWRGLATNAHEQGEPDARIAQATVNALADMGARPTTLQGTLDVDPLTPPVVSSTTPATNATGVATGAAVRATFDQELDPATVGAGDLTLTGPEGAVAGTVSLNVPDKAVVFTPQDPLEPNTVYTATMGTAVKSWRDQAPASARTWSFTTGPGAPPTVLTREPAAGATAIATDTSVQARFDRKLDPATVTASTFTLRPTAGGANVAGTVTYDAATRTAQLAPSARLAPSTQYTATLTTGIRAIDGVAMSAAVTWTFTTGTNVQVANRFPAAGATGISPAAAVRAVFSRAVDAATVTGTSLRLTGPGGAAVAATVSYDPAALTATLVPSSALALSTTYTVTVAGTIRGSDGAATEPASWTFTTAASPPPSPQVTARTPLAGATGVAMSSPVRATFDEAIDPATVTTQSFTLRRGTDAPIAATVTYDAAQRQATLTPLAALAVEASYTATLTTAIRTATGAPLSATVTWTFTTAGCPCALMSGMTPAWTGLPVRDYRPEPGPWTYELGTKVTVSEPAQLVALRYWKEPGETGTHVGRVWTSTGTQLAQVTYQNESASGWQRQALATPITLQPGQTYVLSVGLHAFYAKTTNGLATPLVSGPLQSIPGASGNGVFNGTEGQFPNDSWQSSNYFVDGVVKMPSAPAMTPSVTTRTPTAGATGVATNATVRATFNVAMDPSTVNGTTFRLTDDSTGATVGASVSYDEETRTAVLTPSAPLETGTAYTARLTTGVRSDDETPLAAAVSWSFSTVPPAPPAVTGTSPVDGTTDVGIHAPVTVTFSTAMDAATITSSSFRLTGPGGATVPASVAYDGPTRTATLTPSSPLAGGTAYTARVTTAARSSRNIALPADVVWGFTTVNCPCRLFDAAATPTWTGLSTANGRTGAGPYTMEMGMKIRVTEPAALEALSFYKSPGETGTHIGRLWNSSGQVVASVVFSGETASGWQTQALTTPVNLTVGQVYTVSVGMNQYFVMTSSGLASELRRGPLSSVDDGANGVFAESAGTFPQDNWSESNYWVDAVVR